MSNRDVDINVDDDDVILTPDTVIKQLPATADLVFVVCRLPNSDGTNDYYVASTHPLSDTKQALKESGFDGWID